MCRGRQFFNLRYIVEVNDKYNNSPYPIDSCRVAMSLPIQELVSKIKSLDCSFQHCGANITTTTPLPPHSRLHVIILISIAFLSTHASNVFLKVIARDWSCFQSLGHTVKKRVQRRLSALWGLCGAIRSQVRGDTELVRGGMDHVRHDTEPCSGPTEPCAKQCVNCARRYWAVFEAIMSLCGAIRALCRTKCCNKMPKFHRRRTRQPDFFSNGNRL